MKKHFKVRSYYNQYAGKYDDFYQNIQYQKYSSCKKYLLDKGNGWFIDLGGGTAMLSEWSNYPFLTLDISYKMLIVGLRKKRVFLAIACDICRLPIRKKSIQRIYSFTAIQNLDDPAFVFPEINRILNREGSGIISVLSKTVAKDEMNNWINIAGFNAKAIQIPIEDIAYFITKVNL